MNTEIMKSIGKSTFVEKYPWLFALIVFIGTEVTLYAFNANNNLLNFADNPIKSSAVLLLKLVVFLSLAYGYKYMRSKSKSNK